MVPCAFIRNGMKSFLPAPSIPSISAGSFLFVLVLPGILDILSHHLLSSQVNTQTQTIYLSNAGKYLNSCDGSKQLEMLRNHWCQWLLTGSNFTTHPHPALGQEDVWKCLEMLLSVTTWEYYWHEVDGGHGCYLASGQAQPSPLTPNKELSGPRSQQVLLSSRNPVFHKLI